jgi:hypothetical protein
MTRFLSQVGKRAIDISVDSHIEQNFPMRPSAPGLSVIAAQAACTNAL